MTTGNQQAFQYTDQPLSDYVSSYHGALLKTNGVTYWLERKPTEKKESGLHIARDVLVYGEPHQVSFIVQATEGEMGTIGGSVPGQGSVNVRIDGQEPTGQWKNGVSFAPDDKPHFVTVSFTPKEGAFDGTDGVTICLNKGANTKETINVLLTELHIFQGNSE